MVQTMIVGSGRKLDIVGTLEGGTNQEK